MDFIKSGGQYFRKCRERYAKVFKRTTFTPEKYCWSDVCIKYVLYFPQMHLQQTQGNAVTLFVGIKAPYTADMP